MGDHEDPGKPDGLMLNGLRPSEAATVTEVLDPERWAIVEERIKELITRIQPNKPSEERRLAVANYVTQLIMKCFPCQVFTFGSVPLKTYLPDGDIDLSTFSKNPDLKDTWANEVREILENEEKNETAEFRVKEVQYIKAEVKIIKCLVENIVVDISFNQLGGLCTLCFLDEIDHLISQDHLFKRSIILIKAWCYYESRILGAHHGLLSTYALETLVLYIFHVFNNSFAGPLEVLYRFLEFFSKFDWERFCVSLWGPVPISSLPDTTAEPPRKDSGELLLSQIFLNACGAAYTYLPSGLDNQGQPFGSKYLNVIDPLRTNNNLGRSVSKGNFYRIRSAFSFGTKKLSVLLECPKEDLVAEVDKFFLNTWRRHGTGNRPDAPATIPQQLQPPNSDSNQAMNSYKNQARARKKMENTMTQPGHHISTDVPTPFVDFYGQSVVAGDHISHSYRTNGPSGSQSQKSFDRQVRYRADQFARSVSSSENVQTEKLQSNSKPCNVSIDCTGQGKLQFARTRSSPELSETSAEIQSRSRRNKVPDILENHIVSAKPDVNNRKSFSSDVYVVQNARLDNDSSPRYLSSHQNHFTTVDPNRMHNKFRESTSFSSTGEEPASVSQALEMNQEEQDMVNRMASPGINGLVQPIQFPVNFTSQFPVPPHFLPPFGYMQKNMLIPANMPIQPWAAQFPQGFMPHISGYYPGPRLETNTEEAAESSNDVSSVTELNQEDADHGSWLEQERVAVGFVPPDRSFQIFNEKKVPSFGGLNFMPTVQVSNNVPFMRDPSGNTKENINMKRVGQSETIVLQNTGESDMYSTNRCADTRFLTASQASSSRNMVTDSWDGPPIKASKVPRDRGRKPSSAVSSTSHGSSKSWRRQNDCSVDHVPVARDDDIGEWIKQSSLGNEIAEQSPDSLSPSSASHHPSGSEPTLMSGSDSVFPIPPMIVCPNPRQRSGSGSNSYFYATGPPVPYYILGYKYPSDFGASDGMIEQSNGIDANRSNSLFRDSDSSEKSEQSEVSVSTNLMDDVPSESFEERKPDILHSDFSSHWQNLQYGRLCQDTFAPGPPTYPAPLMVPPVYFQGHHPWDGPGRPFPSPANLLPIVNYHRFVQVMPMQPGSVRHTEVYQHYGDELPSYRGGTGTFLPKAKVPFRERTSSSRNHRPNYGYDRNDHGDREGSWISSKARVSGRSHGRGQHDKLNTRLDRLPSCDNKNDKSWDSHKNGRLVSDVSNHQNNSISSTNPGHANMTYGMYPISSINSDNTHPSGAAVPSFVMLYPCPNLGYGSSSEPVEYGSVGPMHLSSINEVQPHSNGVLRSTFDPRLESYQQNSACSSPDQPSSPRRRI